MEIKKIITGNENIKKELETLTNLGVTELDNFKVEIRDLYDGYFIANIEIDLTKNLDTQIKLADKKYKDDYANTAKQILIYLQKITHDIKEKRMNEKANVELNSINEKAIKEAKESGKPVFIHSNLPFENSSMYAYPNGEIKTIFGKEE